MRCDTVCSLSKITHTDMSDLRHKAASTGYSRFTFPFGVRLLIPLLCGHKDWTYNYYHKIKRYDYYPTLSLPNMAAFDNHSFCDDVIFPVPISRRRTE